MAAPNPFLEAKRRLASYDAEIDAMKKKLSALEAARNELAKSIAVIEGAPADIEMQPPPQRKRDNKKLNLEEKILILLKGDFPDGLETAEMKEVMEEMWGEEVNISSLRTNLSRLRSSETNTITRIKKKWQMAHN